MFRMYAFSEIKLNDSLQVTEYMLYKLGPLSWLKVVNARKEEYEKRKLTKDEMKEEVVSFAF